MNDYYSETWPSPDESKEHDMNIPASDSTNGSNGANGAVGVSYAVDVL